MTAASHTVTTAPERRTGRGEGHRLYERDEYLDELGALFDQSLAVPSRLIAVDGARGTGRTALLNAAAARAAQAGCVVLRATGGTLEAPVPFTVLDRLVASAEHRVEHRLVDGPTGGDAAQQRTQRHSHPGAVAEEFHRLILNLRHLAPVLVAVDDADEADPESVSCLRHLVRRLDDDQIWVLVAARPLHPGTPLRPVDGLLTEAGVRRLPVGPLGHAGVAGVVEDLYGTQSDPAFVAACLTTTAGLPFLLTSLLPALTSAGLPPTEAGAEQVERVTVPRVVRSVLTRLAAAPPETTTLLHACAVLGAGAELGTARALAGLGADEAHEAADAARQLELLRPGRPLTFTAPLLRQSLYSSMPSALRSHLHNAAAGLLIERHAGPDRVIPHLLVTEPGGDPAVARRLRRLGQQAAGAGRCDLAVASFTRALTEEAPAPLRADLHLDLAVAVLDADPASALVHVRQAVDLHQADPERARPAVVALLDRVADIPTLRSEVASWARDRRKVLCTDRPRGSRGSEGADDLLHQRQLEAALAMVSSTPVEWLDCTARIRASERAGVAVDPSRWCGEVLTLVHGLASGSIRAASAADSLEELVRAVPAAGELGPLGARSHRLALYALLCCDRFPPVDEYLAHHAGERQDGPDRVTEPGPSELATLSYLWQGSLTEADERLRRSDPAGRSAADHGGPLPGAIDTLVARGRLDQARELAAASDPMAIADLFVRAYALTERGRLFVAEGRWSEALQQLTALGTELDAAGLCNPALVPWRADAVTALASLGDHAGAARLAHENLDLGRRSGSARTLGVALHTMATVSPEPHERVRWLTEALEVLEPSMARAETAKVLVELGAALVVGATRDDARAILHRAADLAARCGADPVLAEAGLRLRAAGARPRRLGAVGPAALTPSERRVADLAARGCTNQRIADSLFVTVKTVEGHLAKAYRKLGIESRRELAGALAPGDGPRTEAPSPDHRGDGA